MPANQRQQTAQSPALSPTSPNRFTAKYTNKDGSKFITVPKLNSSDSSEPSPAMAQTTKTNGGMSHQPADTGLAPGINRKKAKRRQKQAAQAARLAAEQTMACSEPTKATTRAVKTTIIIRTRPTLPLRTVMTTLPRILPARNRRRRKRKQASLNLHLS
jgi:hypothetical protein